MSAAVRVQWRARQAGWKKPAGQDWVYCGRHTHAGNPTDYGRWGNRYVVGRSYEVSLSGPPVMVTSVEQAIAMYAREIATTPGLIGEIREELAGKRLACWCPLDQPCHVDVLVRVANGGHP